MILKLALTAIIIHIILLFQIYDTYYKYLPVEVKRPLCTLSGASAKRLVLFVIDDLNTNDFSHSTSLQFVRNISDVRGLLEGPLVEDDIQALSAITAGYVPTSKWMSYPWIIKNSFLYDSQNVFYYGPERTKRYFKGHHRFYELQMDPECKTRPLCPLKLYDQYEGILEKLDDPKSVFLFHVQVPDESLINPKMKATWMFELDKFIQDKVEEVTRFYKDSATNFFLTTGYLKSAWGPYKSRGVYFAWGSSFYKKTDFENLNRLKIPALLALTLGVNVPSNSLGILPAELFAVPEEEMRLIVTCAAVQKSALALTMSESFFSQILWVFDGPTQRRWTKSQIGMFYDSYVTNSFLLSPPPSEISREVELESEMMMDQYRTRVAHFLLVLATITLTGWFLYLCLVALSPTEESITTRVRNIFKGGRSAIGKMLIFINVAIMISFIGTSIVTAILTAETYIPLRYELYVILAIFSIFMGYFKLQTTRILSRSWKCIMKIGFVALISVLVIEAVYWMFSFQFDPLLHIILSTIFFSFPLAGGSLRKLPVSVLILWILSWATLLVVLFLRYFHTPTSFITFNLGCLCTILLSFIIVRKFLEGADYGLGMGGTACLAMATMIANLADILTYTNSSNRIAIVLMSWLTMMVPILVPWLGSQRVLPRLILYWIYWSVPLILMSNSLEILGIMAVMITLGSWLAIDLARLKIPYNPANTSEVEPYSRSYLDKNDVFRTLIVFSYIHTSVSLGIGESSATYDNTQWIRSFLFSSTDPAITILIIYKTFISIFLPLSVLVAHSIISGANLRKIYALLLLLFSLLNFRVILFMSWKATEMCQIKFTIMVLILTCIAFLAGKSLKLQKVKEEPVIETKKEIKNPEAEDI